jgi:hypothetical protein
MSPFSGTEKPHKYSRLLGGWYPKTDQDQRFVSGQAERCIVVSDIV